jgi:hypothetical protein
MNIQVRQKRAILLVGERLLSSLEALCPTELQQFFFCLFYTYLKCAPEIEQSAAIQVI